MNDRTDETSFGMPCLVDLLASNCLFFFSNFNWAWGMSDVYE